MKVIHLSTDDVGGGAADAAYRLHKNMVALDISSHMIVLHKKSSDPGVTAVSTPFNFIQKIFSRCLAYTKTFLGLSRKSSTYFYKAPSSPISASRLIELFPFTPDLIVLHWVSNFITPGTMRELSLKTKIPLAWYLMDMGPLTGGCHYSFGCTKYGQDCGNCPQLVERSPNDESYWQLKEKKDAFENLDITAVAASSWLMRQLELSSLFKAKEKSLILLGIDSNVFRPIPREEARKILGLPAKRRIIFFGASNLSEERKGLKFIILALKNLYDELKSDNKEDEINQILIVTAGYSKSPPILNIAFDHHHLGVLHGNEQLALAYQSADLFVNASTEDSGPMMINESLLCGTPVVSFEMGVALDLVHTGKTGYRARLCDEKDLSLGISSILFLNETNRKQMSETCRQYGVEMCHPSVQVKAFEKLYQQLKKKN